MATKRHRSRRLVFGLMASGLVVLSTGVGTAFADSQPGGAPIPGQPPVVVTTAPAKHTVSAAEAEQQATALLNQAKAQGANLVPSYAALVNDPAFKGYLVRFLQSGGTSASDYTSIFQAVANAYNAERDRKLESTPGLKEAAGALSALGGGCTDPITGLTGLSKTSSIVAKGTKAVATITVPNDLCASMDVALFSYKKIGDIPWPGPQILQDYGVVTVKSAGTYTVTADLPTSTVSGAEVDCSEVGGVQVANPAQLDLMSAVGTIGNPGSIVNLAKTSPSALNLYQTAGLQTDVHTDGGLSAQAVPSDLSVVAAASPTEQAKINALTDEACVEGTQVAKVEGTQATSLPNTGSDPLPLTVAGIALIICGWIALCFRSVAPKRS